MRIRSIKPEYWAHRMHKRISEGAALLGVALLNLADDEGRFEADEARIGAALFPLRPLTGGVVKCLGDLVRVGFVELYEGMVDGERVQLGVVVNFKRHQVINKPRRSQLPPPKKESQIPNPKSQIQGENGGDSGDAGGTATGGLRDESGDGGNEGGGTATEPLLRSMEGRKEGKDRKEGGKGVAPSAVLEGVNSWPGRDGNGGSAGGSPGGMVRLQGVIPRDEASAVAFCLAVNPKVSADYAIEKFNQLSGKAWIDPTGRPIMDFGRYVNGRWLEEVRKGTVTSVTANAPDGAAAERNGFDGYEEPSAEDKARGASALSEALKPKKQK